MLDILVPDIRTVMMTQIFVLLLFAGIFMIAWRQGEGSRSAGLLALGLALGFVGNSLWVLRGAASPLLSVIVANVLMHAGTLLVCWAYGTLAGRRFPVWIIPIVVIADTMFFLHFTLVQPDFQARSIVSSVLYAVLYISSGAMLIGERRPWRQVAARVAAVSVVVLGVIHATRAVIFLAQDATVVQQSDPRSVGLLLLGLLVLMIAGLVGLLWVLMADAQNALHAEVESRRASEAALAVAKDAAERVAESRSRFLANMSHEIRTPMNAVIGLARLLEQTPLDSRQRANVTRIAAAADVLMLLTDGVLNVARLEAGQVALDESDFDLVDLLAGVSAIVGPAAEAKGLRFAVERRDDVPTALCGDAGRLSQILLNLAGNAVKFTEAGSVTISIDAAEHAGGRAALRFVVRDTGPGIDLRHLPTIFEPFHQPDAEMARRHGGSGLGLAIARQAAVLMGGSITADSLPGHGSTFTVVLPFGEASGAAEPQTLAVRLDGMRVIVVDDDEVNREVAREILEQAGALVETVRDGREAVAWAVNPAFGIDAVLMDVRMPGIDGLAATAFIREQRSIAELPVIALTAHALDEERQRCLAAGMNDFLTKPIAPAHLLAVLSRWLRPRAAARPVPAGQERLPEAIAGFDLAAAVERFCGNTGLVRHLLERFAERCAEATAVLADPADSGLPSYLHRLQGASATLGADEIASRAAQLSRRLKNGETEAAKADMKAFAQALEATAAAIRAACITTAEPGPVLGPQWRAQRGTASLSEVAA